MGIFDKTSKLQTMPSEEIMTLWQKNVDNIVTNCKHIALGRNLERTPMTFENAAQYVAEKLKLDEIKSFYCLFNDSQSGLHYQIIDLSPCIKIEQDMLNCSIDKLQKNVYSKIVKVVKDKVAYKDDFHFWTPVMEKFANITTIIGFTEDDELARKWQKLSQNQFEFLSEISNKELSDAWKSRIKYVREQVGRYGSKALGDEKFDFRWSLLSYIFKETFFSISNDDCEHLIKSTKSILWERDPFCGNESKYAEDKAAFLVYNIIIAGVSESGLPTISSGWLEFFRARNVDELVEVLAVKDGLDFTINTQAEIILKAYRLRDSSGYNFIPLLKTNISLRKEKPRRDCADSSQFQAWKTPEEMEEVLNNDGSIRELCVDGVSMQGVFLLEKRKAEEREEERREMWRAEREMRIEYEREEQQVRALNAQTNAVLDAQIAQLEMQMENLDIDFMNKRITLLEKCQRQEVIREKIRQLERKKR